jgi:hypothetical protein
MNVLKQLWKKWQAFGKVIGNLVGRVVMTVFYFTIAAPFGLALRLFSDPLKMKPAKPQWELRETEQPTLEDARRAF